MLLFPLTVVLLTARPPAPPPPPPEPKGLAVPALAKGLALEGNLRELGTGVALKGAAAEKGQPTFTARVAYRKDLLYVGAEVMDLTPGKDDTLAMTLHFPEAGATAPGYTFSFNSTSALPAEEGTPAFAVEAVKAVAKATPKGFVVEAAIPPQSLPRWPSKGTMVLELCLTYTHHEPASTSANCEGASMALPLKLPEDYRKSFKIHPPDKPMGVERTEKGWVGYGPLHSPQWIEADDALTPDSLALFVTAKPVDPETVQIPLPAHMSTPDGRTIAAVVTGENPYAVQDQCDMSKDLRLDLYAYRGKVAHRVLEWTAANCGLGRAASITFDGNGGLTMGYSNGASTTFTWSGDHFEQTQLGAR